MAIFSQKSLIDGLWKELRPLEAKKRLEDGKEDDGTGYVNYLNNEIEKRGKLINALLDYFFDPEKEKEYIEENKWLTRDEQIRG